VGGGGVQLDWIPNIVLISSGPHLPLVSFGGVVVFSPYRAISVTVPRAHWGETGSGVPNPCPTGRASGPDMSCLRNPSFSITGKTAGWEARLIPGH